MLNSSAALLNCWPGWARECSIKYNEAIGEILPNGPRFAELTGLLEIFTCHPRLARRAPVLQRFRYYRRFGGVGVLVNVTALYQGDSKVY